MQLTEVTPPTSPVLELNDAKGFLRVLHTDDDIFIQDTIDSVVEHTQNILNRQLGVATYELYLDDFRSILPKNPIKSVDKIEYMDVDLNYVELNVSTYYLYERNEIGCISYSEVPSLPEHKKAVKITFTCGYDSVPKPILSYMRVKVSTLYENHEEYVIGSIVSDFNDGLVKNLLASYKVHP